MIKDKRIDEYIDSAHSFAKPILRLIRNLVHRACPEVKETIKWGFPHFDYKGMLCSMAAFQKHCAFGFWKGEIMEDPHALMDKAREQGMGQFGRLTSLEDLPPEAVMISYIHAAMRLNDQGIKLPKKTSTKEKKVVIPDYFLEAIRKNKKALATFEQFPPSKQKDYIEWIVEAKQEATRERRMATAVEWLSEGKSRNWKYEQCSS